MACVLPDVFFFFQHEIVCIFKWRTTYRTTWLSRHLAPVTINITDLVLLISHRFEWPSQSWTLGVERRRTCNLHKLEKKHLPLSNERKKLCIRAEARKMASNWLQEGQTKQLYMFKKVVIDGGCLWKHKDIHAISVCS